LGISLLILNILFTFFNQITKARTYNWESGKKATEGISQEPSFKSDFISIHSPNHGSDLLTDFADPKEVNANPLVPKKLYHNDSGEYDSFGMDEFNENNKNDQPIFMKFDKVGIFSEK